MYYFNTEKNIFTKLYVILFTIISISKFVAVIIVEPMTIYKIILLHHINNNEIELHSINRNIQASNQECCICLQIESQKEWASLKCNHEFHYECINQWILLKNNCPICKSRQIPMCFDSHIQECHSGEFHSTDSVVHCSNCSTYFLWADYVSHANKCSNLKDSFTCKKCNAKLGHKELKKHFLNVSCPTKPIVTHDTSILDEQE